jgi:hypothetical protein
MNQGTRARAVGKSAFSICSSTASAKNCAGGLTSWYRSPAAGGCKPDSNTATRSALEELRGRPYELVSVAGGWRLQTREQHGDAIRAAMGISKTAKQLTKAEAG